MPIINGIKYACEPCMRGHRSSKCTHSDRILVQVRKPGRPLSSCPHPDGQCDCGGVRVAIPKAASCACGGTTHGPTSCHENDEKPKIAPAAPKRVQKRSVRQKSLSGWPGQISAAVAQASSQQELMKTSAEVPPPSKGCGCGTSNGPPTAGKKDDAPLARSPPAGLPLSSLAMPFSSNDAHVPQYPPSTALYTVPSQYTTFQHPLTPEELAFIQQNPGLLSHPMPTGGSSEPIGSTADNTHHCGCGEGCQCLGCISHPYNLRTLDFVQSIQSFLASDQTLELPGSRPVSLQPPPADISPIATTSPFWATPLTGVPGPTGEWSVPQSSGAFVPPPVPPPVPHPNMEYGGLSAMQSFEPMFASTSDMQQQQQAVSPTAFFHVNYPTGCGAGTTCSCVDRCLCPSCPAHNGHNLEGSQPTSIGGMVTSTGATPSGHR